MSAGRRAVARGGAEGGARGGAGHRNPVIPVQVVIDVQNGPTVHSGA